MRENLFSTKYPKSNKDDFEVFIHDDLFITANPYDAKKEYKRALVEMVDTYSNLILAYSGGMDSSFILCCLRDLIEKKKLTKDAIKVVQGTFTIAGKQLSVDRVRATNFAVDLGFTPKIYNVELDDDMQDEIEAFIIDQHHRIYAAALQDIWASKQKGTVLQAKWMYHKMRPRCHFRETVDQKELFRTHMDRFTEFLPDSNWINCEKWDAKVFSSLITPFKLNKSNIDLQPFEQVKEDGLSHCSGIAVDVQDQILSKPYHPLHPARIDDYLDRIIVYLQCYPEMAKLWCKFPTLDSSLDSNSFCGIKHPFVDRLLNFKKMWKNCVSHDKKWAYVKKLDGTLWTEKDLLNYESYFDVS